MNSIQPPRTGEPTLPPWRDGSLADSGSSLLTRALEAYRALVDAGQRPDRDTFVARYPEIAEALSDCLAGLELVQAAAAGTPDEAATAPGDAAALPIHPLADFRILRELGRGGMGIVYEAEQISLGRRVALKILPLAAALDPRRLQRFRNEAQAAAQLQHPHIVPVYAIGQEHGVHYYAMQFIDGQTLAEVIRRFQHATDMPAGAPTQITQAPTTDAALVPVVPGPATLFDAPVGSPAYFRGVAQLGLQAAEALEQAHQLGIVHRDIKPANLMLDSRGHLWVADFGLARHLGQAENLTLSGDLLGTIRYMSPEQALARHGLVDQRTDIYALGITLYELATRRPAFLAVEREELLRQVCRDDPRSPRWIDPRIPADLETIILKAAAKEPEGRYATARELADDLGRFLRHEPIQARRTRLSERMAKWCRRRPAVVRSVVLVSLLMMAVLGASTFFIGRAEQQSNKKLDRANEKLDRAGDKLHTALGAIDAICRHVDTWFVTVSDADIIQHEFLERAEDFYKQVAKDSPTEAVSMHLRIADLQSKIAEAYADQGKPAAAAASWAQVRAALDEMPATVHQDVGYQLLWCCYYHAKGKALRIAGRYPEAETSIRQALTLLDKFRTRDPQKNREYRYQIAGCANELGLILGATGRGAAARSCFVRAIQVLKGLETKNPGMPWIAHPLAQTYNNYANLLHASIGRRPGHLGTLPSLAAGAVGTGAGRAPLAFAVLVSRHLAVQDQQIRETMQTYGAAIHLLEHLAQRFATYPTPRFELALAWNNVGRLLAEIGEREKARIAYQRSLLNLQELMAVFPKLPLYQTTFAGVQHNLAELPKPLREQCGARPRRSASVRPTRR